MRNFLDTLACVPETKPVVLAVLPDYCSTYVPAALAPDSPPLLSDLYQTSYLKLGYYEVILQIALSTRLTVTAQQSMAVMLKTVDQFSS